MKRVLAAMAALAFFFQSGSVTAQSAGDPPGWIGTYSGSYLCHDGEHGFYLDITAVVPLKGETFAVSAVLGLYPVVAGRSGRSEAASGSFEVSGLLSADQTFRLEPGAWLVQPEGYGAATMVGEIGQREDGLWQITGRPLIPGNEEFCSDLIATQFLPG